MGLFFTTALMTLLVEDIWFHNIYSHAFGVVEQETIMFIMSGFVAPLIWLINPWHIYSKFYRQRHKNDLDLTQSEANSLMEKPHYSIGKRYAEILQGVWFTFLYGSLIPIGSVFTLIGLSLFYWIDKYNLLRRSSVLQNISSHICLKAVTLLDVTPILRPLGQIIFDGQIRYNYNSSSSYIFLIFGLVYLCLPINDILDYFHSEKFSLADQTYSSKKQQFEWNYQQLHPLKRKSFKTFSPFKSRTRLTRNICLGERILTMKR